MNLDNDPEAAKAQDAANEQHVINTHALRLAKYEAKTARMMSAHNRSNAHLQQLFQDHKQVWGAVQGTTNSENAERSVTSHHQYSASIVDDPATFDLAFPLVDPSLQQARGTKEEQNMNSGSSPEASTSGARTSGNNDDGTDFMDSPSNDNSLFDVSLDEEFDLSVGFHVSSSGLDDILEDFQQDNGELSSCTEPSLGSLEPINAIRSRQPWADNYGVTENNNHQSTRGVAYESYFNFSQFGPFNQSSESYENSNSPPVSTLGPAAYGNGHSIGSSYGPPPFPVPVDGYQLSQTMMGPYLASNNINSSAGSTRNGVRCPETADEQMNSNHLSGSQSNDSLPGASFADPMFVPDSPRRIVSSTSASQGSSGNQTAATVVASPVPSNPPKAASTRAKVRDKFYRDAAEPHLHALMLNPDHKFVCFPMPSLNKFVRRYLRLFLDNDPAPPPVRGAEVSYFLYRGFEFYEKFSVWEAGDRARILRNEYEAQEEALKKAKRDRGKYCRSLGIDPPRAVRGKSRKAVPPRRGPTTAMVKHEALVRFQSWQNAAAV